MVYKVLGSAERLAFVTMSLLAVLSSALLLTSPVLTDSLFTYSVSLPTAVKVALGYAPETLLTFEELTEQNGYETEEHFVTTADGYILSLFHVTNPNCTTFYKTPVLLMHGPMESAIVFTDLGKEYGLAYTAADACFNVWVGNVRGTTLGRNHTTLDPDVDAAFWQFSADEYIAYDAPAQIDFILNQTGAAAINYIGFSQGGGTFLGMAAEQSDYNNKVKLFIGIAPLTRLLNTRSYTFRLMLVAANSLRGLLSAVGIHEAMFEGSIFQTVMEYLCQTDDTDSFRYSVCRNVIHLIDSYRVDNITPKVYKVLYTHFPAGVSVQMLAHYGQNTYNEDFQKFDYGTEALNFEHYGSTTPPIYNLTQVTTPAVIFYGKGDFMVDPEDVEWVAGQLPNLVDLISVSDTKCNHADMVKNIKAKSLVYSPAVEYLKQYDD